MLKVIGYMEMVSAWKYKHRLLWQGEKNIGGKCCQRDGISCTRDKEWNSQFSENRFY